MDKNSDLEAPVGLHLVPFRTVISWPGPARLDVLTAPPLVQQYPFFVSFQGHPDGGKKLAEFLEWCVDAGVAIVTVYAFSTENWKRDKQEVKIRCSTNWRSNFLPTFTSTRSGNIII